MVSRIAPTEYCVEAEVLPGTRKPPSILLRQIVSIEAISIYFFDVEDSGV